MCLFVVDDIAWAQDLVHNPSKSSTLAPHSRLTEAEFKEKFVTGEFLLSIEGAIHKLDEEIKEEKDIFKEKWRESRTETIDIDNTSLRGRIKGRVRGLESVVFVKRAGLLASRGQLALVDLTGQVEASKEFGGVPVVYTDSMYCNTTDKCVQKHEIDEILQWEYFRVNVLNIATREEMGNWIRKRLEIPDPKLNETEYKGMTSRQIAKLFDGYSYPLRDLYKRIANEIDLKGPNLKACFDLDYIDRMLSMYPEEKSEGVNIAAQSAADTGKAQPDDENISAGEADDGRVRRLKRANDIVRILLIGKKPIQILPPLVKAENWRAVQIVVRKIEGDGLDKLNPDDLAYFKQVKSQLGEFIRKRAALRHKKPKTKVLEDKSYYVYSTRTRYKPFPSTRQRIEWQPKIVEALRREEKLNPSGKIGDLETFLSIKMQLFSTKGKGGLIYIWHGYHVAIGKRRITLPEGAKVHHFILKDFGLVPDELWNEYLRHPFPSPAQKKKWQASLKVALESEKYLNDKGQIKDLTTLLGIKTNFYTSRRGKNSASIIYSAYVHAIGKAKRLSLPEGAQIVHSILFNLGFINKDLWIEYLEHQRRKPFPSSGQRDIWQRGFKKSLQEAGKLNAAGVIGDLGTLLSIDTEFVNSHGGENSPYAIWQAYRKAIANGRFTVSPAAALINHAILNDLGLVDKRVWDEYVETLNTADKRRREKWKEWLRSVLSKSGKLNERGLVKDLKTLMSITWEFFNSKENAEDISRIYASYHRRITNRQIRLPKGAYIQHYILKDLDFISYALWQDYLKPPFPSKEQRERWQRILQQILASSGKLNDKGTIRDLKALLSIEAAFIKKGSALNGMYQAYVKAIRRGRFGVEPDAFIQHIILRNLGFINDSLWQDYLRYQARPKPFPSQKQIEKWKRILQEILSGDNKLDGSNKIKDLATLLNIKAKYLSGRPATYVIYQEFIKAIGNKRQWVPRRAFIHHFILYKLGFVTGKVWKEYLKYKKTGTRGGPSLEKPAAGPAVDTKKPKGSCADCLNSIIGDDKLLEKALNEGFDIETDLKPVRLKLKDPDQPFSDTTIYDREITPLIDLGILIRLSSGRLKFSDMMMRPNTTGPPDKQYTINLIRQITEINYPIGEKGPAKDKPFHRGEIPPEMRPAIKKLVMEAVRRCQKAPPPVAPPASDTGADMAKKKAVGAAKSAAKTTARDSITPEVVEARKHLVRAESLVGVSDEEAREYELARIEYGRAIALALAIKDESPKVKEVVEETIRDAKAGIVDCEKMIKSTILLSITIEEFNATAINLLSQRITGTRRYWIEELGRNPTREDLEILRLELEEYYQSLFSVYSKNKNPLELKAFRGDIAKAQKTAYRLIREFMTEYSEDIEVMGLLTVVEPDRVKAVGPSESRELAQVPPEISSREITAESAAMPLAKMERQDLLDLLPYESLPERVYQEQIAPYSARCGGKLPDIIRAIIEDRNWRLAVDVIRKVIKSEIELQWNERDRRNFAQTIEIVVRELTGASGRWIMNIRSTIRYYRPCIMLLYDDLPNLSPEQKDLLRKEIYTIDSGQIEIWGLGIIGNKRLLPCFKGSYINALIAAFPGIELDPLGFRLDWTTRDRAIASLRFVLSREIPDIVKRYDSLDKLDQSQVRALRRDIYRITQAHFKAWQLINAIDKDHVQHFNGSFIDALIAVFPGLNLNRLGFWLDWSTRESAIESVRFVISQEVPDIVERYDRIDTLEPKDVELLRRDIYGCMTAGRFKTWGLDTIASLKWVPYFNASYIEALIAVFPKLALNPLGFHFEWSSREQAIESIRYALAKEAPYILERYDKISSLSSGGIKVLRDDICAITNAHFQVWGLNTAMNRKLAPYFEGSYINALLAVFEDERLGLTIEALKRFRKAHVEKVYHWDEGRELAIKNIHDAIRRNRPDIMERYMDMRGLGPSEVEALKRDIHRIDHAHLKLWGISALSNMKSTPYFERNYPNALVAAFSGLDLDPLGFKLDWSSRGRAVASISFVLSKEVPDIMERYGNIGTLDPEAKETLRRDIYQRIGQHEIVAWGLASILRKKEVPYFNGRYIDALTAVFSKLGLDTLGFRLDWSSRERAIASIRFILGQQVPDIMKRYDDRGRLTELQKEILRKDIYRRITAGRLELWKLGNIFNKDQVPYFNGSYIDVMTAVFPDLDLNPLGFQLDWSTRERGIESLRYVFRQEAPSIMGRYENADALKEAEKESLRHDIYAIGSAHLNAWGATGALHEKRAPYFHGSCAEAVAAVFPKLDLNPLGFQLDWSTWEKAIESLRFVFAREMPDILKAYDKVKELSPSQLEGLKAGIYGINWKDFIRWGLSSVLNKRTVPYFNGSPVEALLAVFSDEKLALKHSGFLTSRKFPASPAAPKPPDPATGADGVGGAKRELRPPAMGLFGNRRTRTWDRLTGGGGERFMKPPAEEPMWFSADAGVPEDGAGLYAGVPEEDRRIARNCIWYFLGKGIHFVCSLEDVFQAVFAGFAAARQGNQKISEDELYKIGRYTAAKVAREESKFRDIIAHLKEGDIKPLTEDTFGERLKLLRIEKGLTQARLGGMVGVLKSSISQWETLGVLPEVFSMKKLAETLDTTVCYLMVGMSEEELMNIRIEDENSPEYRKIFGLKIKVLRNKLGLFQKELGNRAGMNQMMIYDYEIGNSIPRPHHMKKLAEILGATVSHLMTGMSEEELMKMFVENDASPEYRRLFGLKMKTLRYKLGLFQKELGDIVGVSKITVTQWESGENFPHPLNMKKLAEALGTTVSYLMAGMSEEELMKRRIEDKNSPHFRKLLGLKIKVLRYKIGMTSRELAKKAGVNVNALAFWEAGERFPRFISLVKLAAALDTNSQKLLGEEIGKVEHNVPGAPAASEQLTARNVPDIEYLRRILNNIVTRQEKESDGKYFTIRYDSVKIPQNSPAERLLRMYVEQILRSWMLGKGRVNLEGSKAQGKGVIWVECYKDQARDKRIGEAHVDIKEYQKDEAFRLIGMVNMAILASQIPAQMPPEEADRYEPLKDIIKKQFVDLGGDAQTIEDALKDAARGIWITLPHAAQVPTDRTVKYYELTMKQLDEAA